MSTTTAEEPAAASAAPRRERRTQGVGIGPVVRKEFADLVSGVRFYILLAALAVFAVAAMFVSTQTIRDVISTNLNQITDARNVFLAAFTTANESVPVSFLDLISFLGPLVGIALGIDAVNAERNRGTLARLVAQPIHRDAIINGKFVAGLLVVAVLFGAMFLVVSGVNLLILGLAPSPEEVIRIFLFYVLTVIYVGFWLGLSILLSTAVRQAGTAALAALAVWMLFVLLWGLLAGLAANAIAPEPSDATIDEQVHNDAVQSGIIRLSPAGLYSEASEVLLAPSERTTSIGAQLRLAQSGGAVTGAPLSLPQSMLLVWPQLTGIIAATVVCFAFAYGVFMRQEIRS